MDKPHLIDYGQGLVPASTQEIASVIQLHAMHDGIAFFPDCHECQQKNVRKDQP